MEERERLRAIGRRIRRYRITEGYRSNYELADAVYYDSQVLIDPNHLDEVESFFRFPATDVLVPLADLYGCSVDELLGDQSTAEAPDDLIE